MDKIAKFIQALRELPKLPEVFRPWVDFDPVHDLDSSAPSVRAEQLQRYLAERQERARIILIAEALSYGGGKFTGLAMTSERIMLGYDAVSPEVSPEDVIAGGGRRTSRDDFRDDSWRALGACEPTATEVWGALKKADIDFREVVLWNAFAAHPIKDDGDWLSNRHPTSDELEEGTPTLEMFLDLFPQAALISVGNVARDKLAELGVDCAGHVRHPAHGGEIEFRAGIAKLLLDLGHSH